MLHNRLRGRITKVRFAEFFSLLLTLARPVNVGPPTILTFLTSSNITWRLESFNTSCFSLNNWNIRLYSNILKCRSGGILYFKFRINIRGMITYVVLFINRRLKKLWFRANVQCCLLLLLWKSNYTTINILMIIFLKIVNLLNYYLLISKFHSSMHNFLKRKL